MPLPVQSKILRVLQEGEFSRLGGNVTLHTDVRIVAATNKNLEQEVFKKRFREDLFYRLNVVRVHLPPLRQRIEDVRLLCEYFLAKISLQKHLPAAAFVGGSVEGRWKLSLAGQRARTGKHAPARVRAGDERRAAAQGHPAGNGRAAARLAPESWH